MVSEKGAGPGVHAWYREPAGKKGRHAVPAAAIGGHASTKQPPAYFVLGQAKELRHIRDNCVQRPHPHISMPGHGHTLWLLLQTVLCVPCRVRECSRCGNDLVSLQFGQCMAAGRQPCGHAFAYYFASDFES